MIEQRAALRDQAELIAIELELGGDDLEPGCVELLALEQHARERRLAGPEPPSSTTTSPGAIARSTLSISTRPSGNETRRPLTASGPLGGDFGSLGSRAGSAAIAIDGITRSRSSEVTARKR